MRRYAGVASLWALGVGAVISGRYSGWNLGLLAGGWVGVWFTLGIIWFALVGQNRLVLVPEEAFAIDASESD
jgi:ethanolamine permease